MTHRIVLIAVFFTFCLSINNPLFSMQLPDGFARFADKQTCLYFELDLRRETIWEVLNESVKALPDAERQTRLTQWVDEQRSFSKNCSQRGAEQLFVFGRMGGLVQENIRVVFVCEDETKAKQLRDWLGGSFSVDQQYVIGGSINRVKPALRPSLTDSELADWQNSLTDAESKSDSSSRLEAAPQPKAILRLVFHLNDDQARVLTNGTRFDGLKAMSIRLISKSHFKLGIRYQAGFDNANELFALLSSISTSYAKNISGRLPRSAKLIGMLGREIQEIETVGPISSHSFSFKSQNVAGAVLETLDRYLEHEQDGRRVKNLAKATAALPEFLSQVTCTQDARGVGVGSPRFSWRVGIMPTMGLTDYAPDRRQTWDSSENQMLSGWAPGIFRSNGRNETRLQAVVSSGWERDKVGDQKVYGLVINSNFVEPVNWTRPKDITLEEFDRILELHKRENCAIWVGLSNGRLARFSVGELDKCRAAFTDGLPADELLMLPAEDDEFPLNDPRYNPLDEIPEFLRQPLAPAWLIVSGVAG